MSACFIFQFVPDILGPSLKKECHWNSGNHFEVCPFSGLVSFNADGHLLNGLILLLFLTK